MTGRHDGRRPQAFSYHRGVGLVMAVVVALVVIEGTVVDLVLAFVVPGTAWVWVGLGVHLYALSWLGGLWASFVTRPHLVQGESLHLRDGVFTEVMVPLPAVRDIRMAVINNAGRSGLRIDPATKSALLAIGSASVVMRLEPGEGALTKGPSGPLALSSIAFSVDEPEALVRTLKTLCPNEGVC